MNSQVKAIIYAFVLAIVLSGILLGLRSTAIKDAYESAQPYEITLDNGSTVTIEGSSIDPSTTANLYSLGVGFVWLFFVIFMVLTLVGTLKF